MELVVAILCGIALFYRERLDNTTGFKVNSEKENYVLCLSIFYLIQSMLALAIIEILKISNELIIESVYMVFNSICSTAILLGSLSFIKGIHEKTIDFRKIPMGLGVIGISLAIKVFVSLGFLLNTHDMSEVRQFTKTREKLRPSGR